jgi:hypothetical protein
MNTSFFARIAILTVMIVVGKAQKTEEFYYRDIERPEGEVYGKLFKITIINGDSVDNVVQVIRFEGPIDGVMTLIDLPGPAWLPRPRTENDVTEELHDWEYFERFPEAVRNLPIERGFVIGDSLFIYRAFLRYKPQLSGKLTKMDYYDFVGFIKGNEIHGLLTKEFFMPRYNERKEDTFYHGQVSYEVIFSRRRD